MGREIKRVPLDFNWPIDQRWDGYLNNLSEGHVSHCSTCNGFGMTSEAKHMADQWYGNDAYFHPSMTGSTPYTPETPAIRAWSERQCNRGAWFYGSGEDAILRESIRICALWNKSWSHHLDADDVAALLAAGRLWDFTRTKAPVDNPNAPRHPNGWLMEDNGYIPEPWEVNLWSLAGFGHDSINQWIIVKAKCKRLGVHYQCAACGGSGNVWDSPESKVAFDTWKPTEPPVGEGWQVWETVTEGSPISPVFRAITKLKEWLMENEHCSFQAADAFIHQGHAFSVVAQDGVVQTGVQAAEEIG